MSGEFLEELRRVLDYNPETGEFKWKVDVGRRAAAGFPAGYVRNDCKLRITFKRKLHLAHRLAWLMAYGKWSEKFIDHIDGNPLNNQLVNLRDVSRSINNQNQRKARSDSKSSFLGVSLHEQSGKFLAQINLGGKKKYLGLFLTAKAAHEAYLSAKRKFHEGCTI